MSSTQPTKAEQREGEVSHPITRVDLPVWEFGTMPVPELPGCTVLVRPPGNSPSVQLLRGVKTGLWLPLHLAPRAAISNVPGTPFHEGVPTDTEPMPFVWWRERYLLLDSSLGAAWAVVIPAYEEWV